jgi:hypothetical protein
MPYAALENAAPAPRLAPGIVSRTSPENIDADARFSPKPRVLSVEVLTRIGSDHRRHHH